MPKTKAELQKDPWSPGAKRIARALHACSMLPGSWDKRFARDLAQMADADDREPGKYWITLAQKQNLIRLAHKYRRQMPPLADLLFEPAQPAAPLERVAEFFGIARVQGESNDALKARLLTFIGQKPPAPGAQFRILGEKL